MINEETEWKPGSFEQANSRSNRRKEEKMSKIKHQIPCPYCLNQGITMNAVVQKTTAQEKDHTRYGCANEHYFARPNAEVAEK